MLVLEEVVEDADKIGKLKLDADVIISRGLITKLLKECNDPFLSLIFLCRALTSFVPRMIARHVSAVKSGRHRSFEYDLWRENLSDIVDLPIQSYILNDIESSVSLVDFSRQRWL